MMARASANEAMLPLIQAKATSSAKSIKRSRSFAAIVAGSSTPTTKSASRPSISSSCPAVSEAESIVRHSYVERSGARGAITSHDAGDRALNAAFGSRVMWVSSPLLV